MDSCFVLIGTRQHCVAKICNASPTAKAHKLKMTRSLYQVPYFKITCAPEHPLPHHVFRGARRQSVSDGVWISKLVFRLRAGSHFDISISTNINISTRKIRKIHMNRGAYAYSYAYACVTPVHTYFSKCEPALTGVHFRSVQFLYFKYSSRNK